MSLWRKKRRKRKSGGGGKKRTLLSVVLCVSAVCCGAYFLYQLWQTEKESRFFPDVPVRGNFFDCSRRELVTTIERVSVYVRLREVVSFAKTAEALSMALGIDRGAIEQRLKKGGLRVWIAEDISEQQEKAVSALAANTALGVHLQKEKKRYYPHDSCGAHLFGVAEDGIGLLGLEARYDQLVAREKQVAGPAVASDKSLVYQRDIVLTLNLQIQKILEEVVAGIRWQTRQEGGEIRVAAYLLASKSGAVIAGAQVPGFNPNDFASYRNEQLENMFFMPFFIPHSIRALLRDCAGFYKTDNNAILAGEWSMSAAGGVGKQLQLMASLGLDQIPEVDFYTAVEGEQKRQRGILVDSGNVPQKMAMIPQVSTPLQLLVALSSLLHGSPAKAPYLVQGFVDPTTGELHSIVSSATGEGKKRGVAQSGLPIKAVKRLFSAVGEKRRYGTLLEGEAFGHFLQQDGGRMFVRNRVVFADIADDKHPLALLLVTEQRQDGPQIKTAVRSRKRLAVDIAEILAKKIGRISLLHMVSIGTDGLLEQQEEYGNFQGKHRFTLEQHGSIAEKQVVMEPWNMPDLRGMSLRAALRRLEGVPVRFSIEGAGVVKKQQPSPGTRLEKGTPCRLILQ